jgi:hypothetical protein
MSSAGVSVVWLVLFAGAHAAEPPAISPGLDSDGFWSGSIVVPATPAEVAALVEDPIQSARYSPDIETTAYVARGVCDTLRAALSGAIPVTYDYKRCRTSNGWHETLLSSELLSVYEVKWSFSPAPGGTQVDYGVKIGTHFPAPDFVFARRMKDAITTILGRVYRKATE